jgi:hypothetical protein
MFLVFNGSKSRLRERLRVPPPSQTDYSVLLHSLPHNSHQHHTAVLTVPALQSHKGKHIPLSRPYVSRFMVCCDATGQQHSD